VTASHATDDIGRLLNPGGGSAEVAALAEVARALEVAFARCSSAEDDLVCVNAMIAEVGDTECVATQRDIEALVALGVLGRMISGGESHLIWMRGTRARREATPAAHHPADGHDNARAGFLSPRKRRGSRQVKVDDREQASTEEFRLDLAIDLEREKLLLYRVALTFEGVALVVIVRQIILGLM
jgi:hypothetical protein